MAEQNKRTPSKCKVLSKNYRGYRIESCDGVVETVSKDKSRFIVALDDSKLSGSRKFVSSANNIKTAKKYIDWVTRKRN